jgi:hypothetical protein
LTFHHSKTVRAKVWDLNHSIFRQKHFIYFGCPEKIPKRCAKRRPNTRPAIAFAFAVGGLRWCEYYESVSRLDRLSVPISMGLSVRDNSRTMRGLRGKLLGTSFATRLSNGWKHSSCFMTGLTHEQLSNLWQTAKTGKMSVRGTKKEY